MDYILRATAGEGAVRMFIANTHDTAQKAFEIHKTSPVMSAALGRALTGVAIMGSMLKNDDDLVTITIKGDGPGKGLTVTSNSKSQVKGYAYNPMVDIPLKPNGKLDVQAALGFGDMTVIKDIGMREPYVGKIPLISGEIAEDLTYYFAKSEQTPSAVALGVLVDRDYTIKQSGGYVIQMMPDAPEEIITALEEKLKTIEPMTTMLEKGMTQEDVLNELMGDYNPQILEKIPVEYYCNCDRNRVEKALIAVGKDEIQDIIDKEGSTSLHCHFCNTDYEFSKEELQDLLKRVM